MPETINCWTHCKTLRMKYCLVRNKSLVCSEVGDFSILMLNCCQMKLIRWKYRLVWKWFCSRYTVVFVWAQYVIASNIIDFCWSPLSHMFCTWHDSPSTKKAPLSGWFIKVCRVSILNLIKIFWTFFYLLHWSPVI